MDQGRPKLTPGRGLSLDRPNGSANVLNKPRAGLLTDADPSRLSRRNQSPLNPMIRFEPIAKRLLLPE